MTKTLNGTMYAERDHLKIVQSNLDIRTNPVIEKTIQAKTGFLISGLHLFDIRTKYPDIETRWPPNGYSIRSA
jgi:hypothetical protein